MLSLRYSSKQLGEKEAEREGLLQKYGLFIKLSGAALFLIVFGIVGFFVLSPNTTHGPVPHSISNSTNGRTGQTEPYIAPVVPDQAPVSSQNSQPTASLSNGESTTSVVTEEKPPVSPLAAFLQKHKTIIIAVSVVTAVLLLVGIAIAVILYKRHFDELAALEQRMLEEEAAALAEQLRLEEERRHAWSIWSIIKRYGPVYFLLSVLCSLFLGIGMKMTSDGAPNSNSRVVFWTLVSMCCLSGVPTFLLFLVYHALYYFVDKNPKGVIARIGRIIAQILFVPLYILSGLPILLTCLINRDLSLISIIAGPFIKSFSIN